jgi:hypothetical protein
MHEARVFAVHDDGTKNLSPAMEFGKIEVLCGGRGYPMFGDATGALAAMGRKLQELYNPDTDYLLMVGDPLFIAAAGHFAGQRSKAVKCLKWDKQERKYVPVVLNLNP